MKCDKLTKAEIAVQKGRFIKTFGFAFDPVPFSSKEILYRERFWEQYEIWRKGGSAR
jgi:hypothetical protein